MKNQVSNSTGELASVKNAEYVMELNEQNKAERIEPEMRRKSRLNIAVHVLFNVGFIVYFAFATKYYIDQGSPPIDFGESYGLLVVLFSFVYLIVIYKVIYKPYVSNLLKNSCDSLGNVIVKLFKHRYIQIIFYSIVFSALLAFLIYDSLEDPHKLIALAGFSLLLFFGYLSSKHRAQVRWRPVLCGIIAQFALGLFTIKWSVGRQIFSVAGDKVTTFLGYADVGSTFAYGDFLIHDVKAFAFQAMSVIFFLSFCINILYYYGVIQVVVTSLGGVLQRLMGTTTCESVNSAANIFLGMTEAPLLFRPYLPHLTLSELHAVMAAGFASVSGTVLAAYIAFGANASNLITASVMSAPAALCFSKLTYPETEKSKYSGSKIAIEECEDSSVLDAAMRGANTGVQLVLGIVSNIIACIAFVAFINGVLSWFGALVGAPELTLDELLSYAFMPLSYVLGVPWPECRTVGKLIGIKTVVNEFAAYKELGQLIRQKEISQRSQAIATFALCGFSNPGSVGIMISVMSTLVPEKREHVTALAVRAFVSGAVVCFMTAAIAGMLMSENELAT